jgi:predicted phosphate transport protein (TIGR00153 family)
MVRLVPRDEKFFEMFAEMASNLTQGARVMAQMLSNYQAGEVAGAVRKIKEFEHKGDELTHNLFRKLNQTFITPFDREDIHRLASSIDDVLDLVNGAAERMVRYKIENPPPQAAALAGVIVRQSEELSQALALLEKTKGVLERCVEINRLENEADQICRTAVANLFECEKDPITLIKLKELFETLETATDKAEDAANVLEAVVLKSA